jgi:hypothetical protein
MMNDDTVSECEICLIKTTVHLHQSHDFHKNFNKSLNPTAHLNPSVSMHLSMATTQARTLQYWIKMNLSLRNITSRNINLYSTCVLWAGRHLNLISPRSSILSVGQPQPQPFK